MLSVIAVFFTKACRDYKHLCRGAEGSDGSVGLILIAIWAPNSLVIWSVPKWKLKSHSFSTLCVLLASWHSIPMNLKINECLGNQIYVFIPRTEHFKILLGTHTGFWVLKTDQNFYLFPHASLNDHSLSNHLNVWWYYEWVVLITRHCTYDGCSLSMITWLPFVTLFCWLPINKING